jgi:hypothetical protein
MSVSDFLFGEAPTCTKCGGKGRTRNKVPVRSGLGPVGGRTRMVRCPWAGHG